MELKESGESARANVSILSCKLDYNWHSSVRLDDCLNCSVSGISSIGNAEIGLYWLRSSGCSASDNVAGNTKYGMWLGDCRNCSLSRNMIRSSQDGGSARDVKNMLLDINRLKSLGWSPKLDSAEAIRQATKYLISEES